MNQWYYVLAGQSVGPVPKSELKSRLESGSLAAETLVWTADLNEWVAASEVDELQPWKSSLPPDLPPAALAKGALRTQNSEAGDSETSGPQVRPWLRYGARAIDFLLFRLAADSVITRIFPTTEPVYVIILGLLLMAGYILVEAAMLTVWGTTPGKSLLRVRLRKQDGSRFTYHEALMRSAKVWVRGEGCGLPIVNMVAHIMAYNRLLNTGSTSWDEEENTIVSHQIIGNSRTILIVSILIGFIALMAYAQAG
jgi:hypothetical protein